MNFFDEQLSIKTQMDQTCLSSGSSLKMSRSSSTNANDPSASSFVTFLISISSKRVPYCSLSSLCTNTIHNPFIVIQLDSWWFKPDGNGFQEYRSINQDLQFKWSSDTGKQHRTLMVITCTWNECMRRWTKFKRNWPSFACKLILFEHLFYSHTNEVSKISINCNYHLRKYCRSRLA